MTTTANRVGPTSPAPSTRSSTPTTGPGSTDGPAGGSRDIVAELIGAVAVLAGSSALGPVLIGRSWVLPLIEVVVVVTLLGIGGRLVRLPVVGVVLLQLAGLVIALTSLFTTAGIAGVLPNPAAVGQARTLMDGAWQQIQGSVPPALSSPELSFLISLSIGVSALIVDYLIAASRTPALVALPLLCLYSVPASIALDLLPWYAFAAPAALYALLLAVGRRPGQHAGLRVGVGVAVTGTLITALAVVVTLLVADGSSFVGTAGRLPRGVATTGELGLSPFTSLRGDLQRAQPVNLITVRGLPEPDYLRTVALTTWTNGQGFAATNLRTDQESSGGTLSVKPVASADLTVSVTSTAFRDKFLPLLTGATAVTGLDQSWEFDSSLGSAHRADAIDPGTYTIRASSTKPFIDDLEQDTVTPGGTLTDVGALPTSVRQLAQQVTKAQTTAFDKARALQQWFTDPANGFKYSLQVPVGDSGDALVDFLNNRQGFCEQYATAMAVMLRSLGIPARVGVGFTQGAQQPDGSWVITSHDAHAWVEVDFDADGWVRFDPTPLVNGQGGQQGFTSPAPQTSAAASSTSSSTATSAVTANGNKADQDTTQASSAPLTADAPGTGTAWIGRWLWLILALLLLGVLLLGPAAFRVLRRRRRLRQIRAGDPHAATLAWVEIEDLAVDHGLGVGVAESSRAAANRLARRARLDDQDRTRLRQVIVGAEREWYGPDPAVGPTSGAGGTTTLVATAPVKADDLTAAIEGVRRGLTENAPTTIGERWLPRSLRSGRG